RHDSSDRRAYRRRHAGATEERVSSHPGKSAWRQYRMNQNALQRYGNLLTIRDWLRYAVSRFNRADLFYGHGTDNAYDEAAYLVLHTLHLPLDTLEPFLDARLLDHERAAVRDVIERRVTERLPAPYITGEAWLRGRRFEV